MGLKSVYAADLLLNKSKFLESCVFGDRFHRIHVERRLKLRFQRKRIACGQGDIVGVLCFRLRQSVLLDST